MHTTAIAPQAAVPHTRTLTRILPAVARVGLGLIFFVFGLDGFLAFIPRPSAPPPGGPWPSASHCSRPAT